MLAVPWHIAVPKVVPAVELRTVAVRPSAGAIQRPIAASLEPPGPATEPDAPDPAPDR